MPKAHFVEIMNTFYNQYTLSMEESVEFQALVSATDDMLEDNDAESISVASTMHLFREPAIFRRRWDSQYLMDLAQREGSFVSEYRVDPQGFDILVNLLEEVMPMNIKMAQLKSLESNTDPVSTASKLGAALIVLSGGRVMESMRTHGLSRSYCYDNLHSVVRAINKHPAAISTGNTAAYCQIKADRIKKRSSYGIFKYCTGCIDGLALSLEAPNRNKYKNQALL